ncbi:prolyl oligopeptidase family serine peptidase [Sphingomonas donggukensis]|uniref:Prolyl oligopeptidase family serine peptidase n=1 Tax=Sphingomonas donggukensis TaxID=2949093 RepID=A0ABY4TXI9_9SPHN|nr:prolyl oligopeptidase family serine peptidase [Sphingomonas donggukensis]URW75246.1 prolyl oligopeptidase family serine peptidase [Sphingomonas donggukensis]
MRLLLAATLLASAAAPAAAQIAKPAAITADGVPALPVSLAEAMRPYAESRSAAPVAWNPVTKALVVSTRFANVAQLHSVAGPMMDRRQISFEPDRTSELHYSRSGDVALVQKDVGGNEFFQLYTLKDGRLTLLTDGKSRNNFGAFSADGRLVGYTSTKRTGADNDIYVMDPRNPGSARLVAQVKGGGWSFVDFLPGNTHAVVYNYSSIQKSDLYDLDLATGRMTPLNDLAKPVSYGSAQVSPDGTLWVLSDEGSDFQRLGILKGGSFTPVAPEPKWGVEEFSIADDGGFIAYLVNEGGTSRLKLLDTKTRRVRTAALPTGVASGLEIAPWGAVAFSFSSPKVSGDAFVLDPRSMKVTQWTASETGGLDPAKNVDAQLVAVKSFDGEDVSGFLFRPDPAKFPGKRPLLIDIHGGPEGQTQPSYRGAANYYLNDLGIAIFYPNVRGSTGYGKRFVSLDNGPFKREDSVKDIGAFLDHFARDGAIDSARIGVQGGSYGGYMCYASAIRYGDRLKGANCIVAISNFVTFLENTQSYRRDLRRVEYGDERVAEQKAKLIAISPMTSVSKLRVPLMVVTGGNDPRVPASEADQMVKAVRANGGTAWHILAADEGHGFAKKENRDYQNYATLYFWSKNLLGKTPK